MRKKINFEGSSTSVKRTLHSLNFKYNVGDFVIVMFENKKFPGRITAIREKGAYVDCIEKKSKSWRWPTKKDCIKYEWGDVIGKIEPPKLCKRNFFGVPDLDEFV